MLGSSFIWRRFSTLPFSTQSNSTRRFPAFRVPGRLVVAACLALAVISSAVPAVQAQQRVILVAPGQVMIQGGMAVDASGTPLAPAVAAAPTPVPPPEPAVFTIEGERIAGRPTAIEDGQLVLPTEPARRISLQDLDRLELVGTTTLEAQWVGQDNHDSVQASGTPGPDTVQDIHVRLSGLAYGAAVRQVVVACHNPVHRGVWRFDTSRTPNWKVDLVQVEGTDVADIYFQPDTIDSFEQDYTITVSYLDGRTGRVKVHATTHTSDQAKVVAADATAASTESAAAQVMVHGLDGLLVRGKLLAIQEDALLVEATWTAEVRIPLDQVLGIAFLSHSSADAKERFQKALAAPAAEDTAIVAGRDQALSQILGTVEGLNEGKLKFNFDGETRSMNQARVAGLVFAARSEPPAKRNQPYQVFQLATGDRLLGTWTGLSDGKVSLTSLWGSPIEVPESAVAQIVFRNGKVVYLSDLEPSSVEEAGYFGRTMPYKRDQALTGGPLKIKGNSFRKGLAVHSRSVLKYTLDGPYVSLKAVLGFDESASGRGRVICRILGDGKELLSEPDLRGTTEAKTIEIPLANVKELTLVVDFGEAEDVGDRVIWGDARLYRDVTQQANAAQSNATANK